MKAGPLKMMNYSLLKKSQKSLRPIGLCVHTATRINYIAGLRLMGFKIGSRQLFVEPTHFQMCTLTQTIEKK